LKNFDDCKISIFIDVDETITRDCGASAMPNSIECIKRLSDKCNIYIWSQGGANYVQMIVDTFELNEFVCGVLPKPDIIIDDLIANSQWIKKYFFPNWQYILEFEKKLTGDYIDDGDLLYDKNIKSY